MGKAGNFPDKMLWFIFLKIYAIAALSYLAVAACYFSWRLSQKK